MQTAKFLTKALVATLLVATTITIAHATTSAGVGSSGSGLQGRDAFASIWTTVKNWTEGTLGKVIALAIVLVGIASGIVRQSLMGLVVGIAGGVGLYHAPTIIDSVMGATQYVAEVDLNSFAFWANFK